MNDTDIIATVAPSAGRRIVGMGMLYALGGLILYIVLAAPPASLAGVVFLAGFGMLMIWSAEKMRRATSHGVVLTKTELRTTDGRVLARVSDMVLVDRGTFAFKPSNGFTVRTKTAQPRGWGPGIWWVIGRRVGVGGVTAASQAKGMAEVLSLMIEERKIAAENNVS